MHYLILFLCCLLISINVPARACSFLTLEYVLVISKCRTILELLELYEKKCGFFDG